MDRCRKFDFMDEATAAAAAASALPAVRGGEVVDARLPRRASREHKLGSPICKMD